MPGVSLTRWTSRAEPRADRRQKGVIARVRCAIRGGSQARTTAPDLRSGLAGVHGFKSLARAARSGKSHPPHSMRATRPPLRKTFIRGYPLAAREEGTMSRKTKTMLFAALGLVVVASALVAPIVGAMSSIGPRPEKAVTITLYGSYTSPGGWGRGPNNITEPGPTLTVDQGDVVTFQLFANDSMAHQLIIDVDNSHSNHSGDGRSYPFSSKTTCGCRRNHARATCAGVFPWIFPIRRSSRTSGALARTFAGLNRSSSERTRSFGLLPLWYFPDRRPFPMGLQARIPIPSRAQYGRTSFSTSRWSMLYRTWFDVRSVRERWLLASRMSRTAKLLTPM